MGLGGGLIWTGVVRNLKDKFPNARIYLLYRPGIKSLIFRLPYSEAEVFVNNPDICGVVTKFSFEYPCLVLRGIFNKNILLVDINDKKLCYWDSFKHNRMIYKQGRHAIAVGCEKWGIANPKLCTRIELLESEKLAAQKILDQYNLKTGEYIVIEPHVKDENTPNKLWKFENWQMLVDRLNEWIKINNLNCAVVQVGVRNSKVLDGVTDMTGKTTFRQVAYVLKNARLLIAHEGGLVHLAKAVNTKAVVLIGALLPKELMAYPDNINFYTDINCKNCGLFEPCPKNRRCMEDISVDKVFKAVKEQLSKNRL
jgi:ADP-heptose:LPS heptosyltransferase